MLISLILVVAVLGFVWWAITTLASVFGLPAPLVAVLQVLIVLVGLLYLLKLFGVSLPAL